MRALQSTEEGVCVCIWVVRYSEADQKNQKIKGEDGRWRVNRVRGVDEVKADSRVTHKASFSGEVEQKTCPTENSGLGSNDAVGWSRKKDIHIGNRVPRIAVRGPPQTSWWQRR